MCQSLTFAQEAELSPMFRDLIIATCICYAQAWGTEPPLGVTLRPDAKPWDWPKPLVAVDFGKRVGYRSTPYEIEAVLRKDGDAELVVYRGGKEVARQFVGLPGQFSVLDVEGPLPVIECWGDRFDGLATRWLQRVVDHPTKGIEVRIDYIEIYTPDKTQAKHPQNHVITRRPHQKPKTFFFYGYHQGDEPEKASAAIIKARTGKP
jgi:hypothetical protein